MPAASYSLRMKQLPKAEYALCRALQERYGITDMSDLFAIALRLMAEVEAFQGMSQRDEGKAWIQHVIAAYKEEHS